MSACCPGTEGPRNDEARDAWVDAPPPAPHPAPRRRGQVLVPGGEFRMGDAHDEGYAGDGEGPVRVVEVAPFLIDVTAVTNQAFAAFVKATGHVTTAERDGYSPVFHSAYTGDGSDVVGQPAQTPWWLTVAGASWRRPEGAASDIAKRQNHPVVHVSHDDALAYCHWAGKRLPTEAEWELAARGGLEGARFPWGDELLPRGKWQMNIFSGDFPHHSTALDGYHTTAPVKTYAPNGYGLYQMSGNVWEWCGDWFDARAPVAARRLDPAGPATGLARVMRGGSYLCHDSYCNRYRVAARSSAPPSSSSANLGFRCANSADRAVH